MFVALMPAYTPSQQPAVRNGISYNFFADNINFT